MVVLLYSSPNDVLVVPLYCSLHDVLVTPLYYSPDGVSLYIAALMMFWLPLYIAALMMFWLPADSGEKVSLGVTVLLAFSVFQLVLADNSPKTSDYFPILSE